jgi:hypothetical protein
VFPEGSRVQGFKGSSAMLKKIGFKESRFPVKMPAGTPITGFPLRSNRQGSRDLFRDIYNNSKFPKGRKIF